MYLKIFLTKYGLLNIFCFLCVTSLLIDQSFVFSKKRTKFLDYKLAPHSIIQTAPVRLNVKEEKLLIEQHHRLKELYLRYLMGDIDRRFHSENVGPIKLYERILNNLRKIKTPNSEIKGRLMAKLTKHYGASKYKDRVSISGEEVAFCIFAIRTLTKLELSPSESEQLRILCSRFLQDYYSDFEDLTLDEFKYLIEACTSLNLPIEAKKNKLLKKMKELYTFHKLAILLPPSAMKNIVFEHFDEFVTSCSYREPNNAWLQAIPVEEIEEKLVEALNKDLVKDGEKFTAIINYLMVLDLPPDKKRTILVKLLNTYGEFPCSYPEKILFVLKHLMDLRLLTLEMKPILLRILQDFNGDFRENILSQGKEIENIGDLYKDSKTARMAFKALISLDLSVSEKKEILFDNLDYPDETIRKRVLRQLISLQLPNSEIETPLFGRILHDSSWKMRLISLKEILKRDLLISKSILLALLEDSSSLVREKALQKLMALSLPLSEKKEILIKCLNNHSNRVQRMAFRRLTRLPLPETEMKEFLLNSCQNNLSYNDLALRKLLKLDLLTEQEWEVFLMGKLRGRESVLYAEDILVRVVKKLLAVGVPCKEIFSHLVEDLSEGFYPHAALSGLLSLPLSEKEISKLKKTLFSRIKEDRKIKKNVDKYIETLFLLPLNKTEKSNLKKLIIEGDALSEKVEMLIKLKVPPFEIFVILEKDIRRATNRVHVFEDSNYPLNEHVFRLHEVEKLMELNLSPSEKMKIFIKLFDLGYFDYVEKEVEVLYEKFAFLDSLKIKNKQNIDLSIHPDANRLFASSL